MFVGQCHTHQIGRASLLNEILQAYLATKFTQSEREHLLKKYDEYMIINLLNNWHKIRQEPLTAELIHFLYDKVKFKKATRLRIGFNKTDFKWQVMNKVFHAIFSGADAHTLKETMRELNSELKKNVFDFYKTVKVVKEKHC
jgi:hypothetical protein